LASAVPFVTAKDIATWESFDGLNRE